MGLSIIINIIHHICKFVNRFYKFFLFFRNFFHNWTKIAFQYIIKLSLIRRNHTMFDLKIQISDFLCYCKDRKVLNEKTMKAYSIDLKQFVKFSQCTFNKNIICNYISFLHNTYKPKTAKRKIATLKAFTRFLMIEDIIEVNPFGKIDTSFREPALLPKIIPIDTIKRIFSGCLFRIIVCFNAI